MRGAALAMALLLAQPAAAQPLSGHGGPVRALAGDGARLVSGGLDRRAILWAPGEPAAPAQIARMPAGAVTALALTPDGFVAGTEDGQVLTWTGSGPEPAGAEPRHAGAVAGLAPLPGGGTASVGGDGDLVMADGARIAAHAGGATGLVRLDAGGDAALASIGADLHLRFWTAEGAPAGALGLDAPPLAVLGIGADRVLVSTGGGQLLVAGPAGAAQALDLSAPPGPIVALARAPDGAVAAAADLRGTIWIIDPATLRVTARHDGAAPVWALAWRGADLVAAGNDGSLRRFDPATLAPRDPDPAALAATPADDPGAAAWRACAVCHSLAPGDHSRAGPSLHGVFGRRVATAPGYAYSAALRAMSLTWTPETVAALFQHGPEAYTPGSRMPEQRLDAPARAALIDFLRRNGA